MYTDQELGHHYQFIQDPKGLDLMTKSELLTAAQGS